MIDLTGRSPSWPVEIEAVWQDCLGRATRNRRMWNTHAWQGDELLREQIGAIMNLDPARLTITAGVRAAALTYARRERVLLLERPTFDGVVYALSDSTAQLCFHPWRTLLSGPLPAGAALWLTSPARNPDGLTLTAEDCALLAGRVAAGHRVIINEAYLWFAPAAARVPGADLLGSFHKIAGLGGRIGWVHSDGFFAEARPEIIGTAPPRVWQRAWALFAAAGALRSLSEWVVGRTRAAMAEFRREVHDHHRDVPSIVGPHVLLPLVPGCDEKTALSRFEQHGYRLTAGSHFRVPFPAVRATFTDVPVEAAGEFGRFAARCGLTVMTRCPVEPL